MKTYKLPNKYSVVHWGPIAYFNELHKALSLARKIANQRWFIHEGERIQLKRGERMTVYRLDPTDRQSDVVQFFNDPKSFQ